MSNPFLYKETILFETIQFSVSTQFDCQKHFYFKIFSLVKQFKFKLSISIVFIYALLNVKTVLFQIIQFSVCTVSMSKTVLFQTIQFSIQKQFNFKQFSLA